METESSTLQVLGLDAVLAGTYDAIAYKVFADGRLVVSVVGGDEVEFGVDEWMDVRFGSDWR